MAYAAAKAMDDAAAQERERRRFDTEQQRAALGLRAAQNQVDWAEADRPFQQERVALGLQRERNAAERDQLAMADEQAARQAADSLGWGAEERAAAQARRQKLVNQVGEGMSRLFASGGQDTSGLVSAYNDGFPDGRTMSLVAQPDGSYAAKQYGPDGSVSGEHTFRNTRELVDASIGAMHPETFYKAMVDREKEGRAAKAREQEFRMRGEQEERLLDRRLQGERDIAAMKSAETPGRQTAANTNYQALVDMGVPSDAARGVAFGTTKVVQINGQNVLFDTANRKVLGQIGLNDNDEYTFTPSSGSQAQGAGQPAAPVGLAPEPIPAQPLPSAGATPSRPGEALDAARSGSLGQVGLPGRSGAPTGQAQTSIPAQASPPAGGTAPRPGAAWDAANGAWVIDHPKYGRIYYRDGQWGTFEGGGQ